jgi:hypothetical protein
VGFCQSFVYNNEENHTIRSVCLKAYSGGHKEDSLGLREAGVVHACCNKPDKRKTKAVRVVYTCSPSTQEAGAGGL